MNDDNHFSVPEIGRAVRRARRLAQAEGKAWSPYKTWQTLTGLRKRCHAKVQKDPKGRDPSTERPAAIESYLERMRYHAGSKDSPVG